MKACIHIYTGDGKGKTSAAMGLALRMAGHGKRVLLAQFLKDGSSGELAALKTLPELHCLRMEEHFGFFWTLSEAEREKEKAAVRRYFAEISEAVEREKPALLILDESIAAYRLGLIPREAFLNFLDRKPEELELVLTGRDAPEELLRRADYVSELVKRKHPFDEGLPAREGVEF
ncbi:cob(I)yrinic acid a,c-diamide adenosyltransferase [Stomatobaculum longum]|jgi:hypothetical protein|uniref:cob(I)yrinic acid a,c-diamide adenosyltransferase n=1 Tax=Stomatobaculum longum TaxID=796942 RepID=UPI0028F00A9D|nr:cob(I)yrinic acid a,c-diamide adenosyltransferase [Stomatobaculum longum]